MERLFFGASRRNFICPNSFAAALPVRLVRSPRAAARPQGDDEPVPLFPNTTWGYGRPCCEARQSLSASRPVRGRSSRSARRIERHDRTRFVTSVSVQFSFWVRAHSSPVWRDCQCAPNQALFPSYERANPTSKKNERYAACLFPRAPLSVRLRIPIRA